MSLCRSASPSNQFVLHAVQSSDRMRVDEWHERFLQPYLRLWSDASQRDSITEVLYLTDISVPHLSHRQLRRAIPLLADCDETGALTLNYFIHAAHGPHIAAPDVEALLYLSPPTNGWILTPAHYDGHGTQTSAHAVLFGGRDQHNLVYTFPVRRPDTRSARLGLPRCVGVLTRPQWHAVDVSLVRASDPPRKRGSFDRPSESRLWGQHKSVSTTWRHQHHCQPSLKADSLVLELCVRSFLFLRVLASSPRAVPEFLDRQRLLG